MWLVQCDLADHSAWFDRQVNDGRGIEATVAKRQLADDIEKRLKKIGFAQVFWRGDGGLYAAPKGLNLFTADEAVNAARGIRKVFLAWQLRDQFTKITLTDVGLRISCHECDVWVSENPAFWSAVDLNLFLKHERELAITGTVAITQKVFEALDTNRDGFDKRISRHARLGNGQVWKVYYDKSLPVAEQMENSISWFKRMFNTKNDTTVTCGSQRFTLKGSIVLCLSHSPLESLSVEFQRVSSQGFGKLESDERWKRAESELVADLMGNAKFEKDSDREKLLADLDREKLCPFRLHLPGLDFPLARIEWFPVKFSRARSFMQVLVPNQNNELWERYAKAVADYEPGTNTPNRPGILATHIVLVSDPGNGHPFVVLCQRSRKQQEHVGLHLGQWSASIEEQVVPSDDYVDVAAKRGLVEELLINYPGSFSTTVSAVFLERGILNLTAGVVCRTTLTFEQIHESWQESLDRDEHSQVVALPLERDLIRGCIEAESLTEEAQERCVKSPDFLNFWQNCGEWRLHPTSAFRLALALWNDEGLRLHN